MSSPALTSARTPAPTLDRPPATAELARVHAVPNSRPGWVR